MKEQTGIDVPRSLSNNLYHYISKVLEVLELCIDKNKSLICIISSNVTLLVTELLGQFQNFQNFLSTPRNH